MASLYQGKMAAIYDAMYQTSLITTKSMLSTMPLSKIIAKPYYWSGTGNLAKRFKENQQDYTGLEYSQSMTLPRKEMKTALSSWGYAGFQS
jgi:hypothetical protein